MSINPGNIRQVIRRRSRVRYVVRFVTAVAMQSLIAILVVLFFVWLIITVNGWLHPPLISSIPTLTTY